MSSVRRAAAVAVALMLPLSTAACTLDPYGTSSSGPTATTRVPAPPSSPTPSVTPSTVSETMSPAPDESRTPDDAAGDTLPFPADTARATGQGTGEEVGTLVDLRVGAHDAFDRVVLQLDGPDIPGWDVSYVDTPVGDPSGAQVDVAGDAVLQVLLHPVAYPEDGSAPYDGPQSIRSPGTHAVDEVVMSSIFEGQLQVFIGVQAGRRPFRVYGMSDPSRVVIEVAAASPPASPTPAASPTPPEASSSPVPAG
ncbi:hypothetical protein Q6348_13330 [Isoptericola sp. b441]|uniref:AMIN-like domain-containing protein n=1 Tax=Actinotalea lenta TaxID=3064654 RepID=A0ABT9DEX5_9CELL|nr:MULTISPECIES: hypothetical protein [unclassified Isoptericola]MDO8108178.1 hypothetical protein [Isoptericola sp. b441]MDO8120151.1 hypothetical protein [Isoptericola sp. b490]